jgi:hypothetical protein
LAVVRWLSESTVVFVLFLQVLAKEEMVERLMKEKEEMASKLGLAEHQVAVLQGRREGREGEVGEGQKRAALELQIKSAVCESLKTQ